MIKKIVIKKWTSACGGDNQPYIERSVWYLFGMIPFWSYTEDVSIVY